MAGEIKISFPFDQRDGSNNLKPFSGGGGLYAWGTTTGDPNNVSVSLYMGDKDHAPNLASATPISNVHADRVVAPAGITVPGGAQFWAYAVGPVPMPSSGNNAIWLAVQDPVAGLSAEVPFVLTGIFDKVPKGCS
jgi:hypothetical protein